MSELRQAIENVLNRHSAENGSNTPDYILATYLESCLEAFDHAVSSRDRWYGVSLQPGRVEVMGP